MQHASYYVHMVAGPDDPAFLQLLRAGYFHRQQGHHMRRETTSDYLLLWVLGGQGQVESQGQVRLARPGDVVMFDKGPMQEYGAHPADPWSIVWAHFDGQAAGDFFKRIRQSQVLQGNLAGRLGLDVSLQHAFHDMIAQGRANPAGHGHLCACLLAAVLGRITHQLNQPRTTSQTSTPDLTELLAYIDHHLDQPLTVDELAREGRISARQLTRRFRQALGVSPLQYVLQQRVAKAALLLSQTQLPIKQIGQAVGCDDPYYFSRLFSQAMHLSPAAYRKAHRDR